MKVWAKKRSKTVSDLSSYINKKLFKGYFTLEESKNCECFDVHFLSVGLLYRIVFALSSIIGIATYGYLYCLCLPYIFIKIDVIEDIVVALRKRGKRNTY